MFSVLHLAPGPLRVRNILVNPLAQAYCPSGKLAADSGDLSW